MPLVLSGSTGIVEANIADNAITTNKISAANITAAKLSSALDLTGKSLSGLDASDLPVGVRTFYRSYSAFGQFGLGAADVQYVLQKNSLFPNKTGVLVITFNMLVKLNNSSGSTDAFYPFIRKNITSAEGAFVNNGNVGGTDLHTYVGWRSNGTYGGDEWRGTTGTCITTHNGTDTYGIVAVTDRQNANYTINNLDMQAFLIEGVTYS